MLDYGKKKSGFPQEEAEPTGYVPGFDGGTDASCGCFLIERGVKAEAGDLRGAGKGPSGTDRCGKGPYGRDRGIQEVHPDQEICGRGGKG